MKVGYVQTAPIFGDKAQNFRLVEGMIGSVSADLLVLPELFATGYAFTSKGEAESFAEGVDGETASFLKSLSQKTGAMIVAGFIEKENGRVYNAAMIVQGDQVVDSYRKIHLFNKETLWFSPGDKPLRTYSVGGVNVGVMICFDWIFPEVARTLALLGADIIAHPCNLVLPYCQQAMVTRCLENRVFAVTANRIGHEKRGEDDFTFTGASQITATRGEVLISAKKDECSVTIVEVDPHDARNKSITTYNDVFQDRRSAYYFHE